MTNAEARAFARRHSRLTYNADCHPWRDRITGAVIGASIAIVVAAVAWVEASRTHHVAATLERAAALNALAGCEGTPWNAASPRR